MSFLHFLHKVVKSISRMRFSMRRLGLVIFLSLIFLVFGCAQDETNKLPPSLKANPEDVAAANTAVSQSRQNAVTVAAQKASPGVVTVVTTAVIETTWNPFFNDPFFQQWGGGGGFFPGPKMEQKVSMSGSGFVFDPSGYIMTAEHVVHGARDVYVILADGTKLPAKIVGSDFAQDIAVLKVDKSGLTAIPLGTSSDLMVGEWVLAMGSPFWGAVKEPQPTITVGVVSAVGRSFHSNDGQSLRAYTNLIQTDAAINLGNSGGPLVNVLGQVIGVNTAIISPQTGNVGIAFAIGIDEAKVAAARIISDEGKRMATLGVYLIPIDSEMKDALKLGDTKGLYIADLEKDGVAAKVGIMRGDVLVSVAGRKMEQVDNYRKAMLELAPGSEVEVTIWRRGNEISGKLKLEEQTHE
jgi:serine protease Do